MSQSLAAQQIIDPYYRADLEILDRYQSFSGEIIRLSLAAIAACGFLEKVGSSPSPEAALSQWPLFPALWLCAVTAFAIAILFALKHRYVSTECMVNHVTYIREFLAGGEKETPEAASERARYLVNLKRCDRLLALSSFALIVGALALAVWIGWPR